MIDKKKDDIFCWLDLDKYEDLEIFEKEWFCSKLKRPHDHPGYLMFMRPEGYNVNAVIFSSNQNKIIYPFFTCKLNDLPPFSNLDETYINIKSPYGYGGATFNGNLEKRTEISLKFENLFKAELKKRGCVSEFVREDLFNESLALRKEGELVEQQENVVVRLNRTKDEIWRSYKAKVRKNVKRAEKNNLRVEFDIQGAYLDGFWKIYIETMERTGANNRFFIKKNRFENLNNKLGKDNGLMYVHVFSEDQIISTELLLISHDVIYSFLGGTLSSAFQLRPNDILKHKVIQWGSKNGLKYYVLGGGVKPGDGIFHYKEAFDPSSIFPFNIRKIIHQKSQYDFLISKRAEYESKEGKVWNPSSDFFPRYLA